MSLARLVITSVVVIVLLAACGQADETSDTTVASATATSTATAVTEAGEDQGPSDSETPSTTVAATTPDESDTATSVAPVDYAVMPEYEVAHRRVADGREDLVIVVEPGSYTEVDLENLVYEIVDRYSPTSAIVVDDPSVVELATLESRTDEQQATLDRHTFLRIENGVEVTFYGPYDALPGMTVGS